MNYIDKGKVIKKIRSWIGSCKTLSFDLDEDIAIDKARKKKMEVQVEILEDLIREIEDIPQEITTKRTGMEKDYIITNCACERCNSHVAKTDIFCPNCGVKFVEEIENE